MTLRETLQACYAAYQRGDIEAAEAQYQAMLTLSTSENSILGDVHHLGALIATAIRRNDVALPRIKSAIKLVPHHHEYLNSMGNILSALQDVPKAIKSYQSSLDVKPDYIDPARNLGKLLIESFDAVAAVSAYENALKHHPDDQQLRIGHVIALKDAMRSDEALLAVKALSAGPEATYLQGQIYGQLSRFSEAEAAYLKSLEAGHNTAASLQNLLQNYWMLEQWDTAEALIKKLQPSADVGMFLSIVRAYASMGDANAAWESLEEGLKKFDSNPYLLCERARLKLGKNDTEGAWEDSFAALSAQPGDLVLMEAVADCAMASGRMNEAMVIAHQALAIVPNNQYWIAVKYTAGRVLKQNYRYYANYNDFVKPYQLTPPKGYANIEEFNLVLKKTLSSLHEFTQHPLDQSLREGTQTALDLRLIDHPVLRAFFEMLDAPIRSYMKMLSQHLRSADRIHPLMRRNTQDYRLSGSWSVQLKTGGFHVNHIHPAGWISSAYYVEVPSEVETSKDKAGWIHFGQPLMPVKGADGALLQPEKYVKPKAGMLVLFPSYLWHGTVPLQGDESRMTLPFDVVPA